MGPVKDFMRHAAKKIADSRYIVNPGNKRLILHMPSYPGPKPESIKSLVNVLTNCVELGLGFDPVMSLTTGAVISALRSEVHKAVLEDDQCIGVVHIDSDMRWPASDAIAGDGDRVTGFNPIQRLLGREKDMIGGLYVGRDPRAIPNAGWFGPDGALRRVSDPALVGPQNGEPFEVDWLGFGFIYISRRAIVRVAELCGDYGYTCEHETRMWSFSDKVAELNKTLDDYKAGEIDAAKVGATFKRLLRSSANYHEDVTFCLRAKEAGIRIWCDPSFELQHYGDYPYSRLDWMALHNLEQSSAGG